MKATGIVRRIDDLGRIVIPKEIRRSFRIKEGDPLEIFTDAEGEVIFKKYSPIGELSNFASQYAEVLHKSGGLPIAIMDNDHVVAASGISKREILERRVTINLEELMENRAIHITNDKIPSVNAIEGYDRKANIVYPIIYGGDVSGAVCMMDNNMDTSRLVVSYCNATAGPTLKRIQARAQGRAYRINKRTSHITITVKELED